jgi:ribonuclease HI
MGGGVAFLQPPDQNASIGIKGLSSSFGAEAGALDYLLSLAPPTTDLTILLDSLSLMQALQDLMDKERVYDPIKHDHSAILRSILSHLNRRSATTLLFKVKSHCGSLLNELADQLAQLGTHLPPQGPDPDPAPLKLHYTPASHPDDEEVAPKRNTITRNMDWLKNLQAWKRAEYTKPDKTFTFMTRKNFSRDLFNTAIRSTAYGLTDTGAKQVLQAFCGSFPTRHKLWLQGRSHTPFCAFCPTTPEYMTHWQCTCPQFKDSRVAAHNYIWTALAALLQKHS